MADKKKAATTATDNAAVVTTPCNSRGKEILREGGIITVPFGGAVDFLLLSCFAPGNLIVRLGEAREAAPPSSVLMNQQVPPPNPVVLSLPPLTRGMHLLHWSFVPVANTWQIVTEISVNDIVKFRLFKSDQSNNPLPTGFMFLEVV